MSELKRCPFSSIPLKLVGSKRRGNQHYLHEYNNNCILNGFGFIATDENIQHWNNRKPMQNIMKRLEENLQKFEEKRKMAESEADKLRFFNFEMALRKAISIVKEEGGIDGSNL